MIHTGRREGQKLRAKAQTLLPVFLCFFFSFNKKDPFEKGCQGQSSAPKCAVWPSNRLFKRLFKHRCPKLPAESGSSSAEL